MKDYAALPSTISIPLSTSTLTFTGPAQKTDVCDVDGDLRGEVLLYDGASNTFGIVSYFNYADVTTSLVNEYNPPVGNNMYGQLTADSLMTTWTPPQGTALPALTSQLPLAAGDLFTLSDLDGDGAEEVVLFSYATMVLVVLKWIDNQLQLVYSSYDASRPWTMNGTGIVLNPSVQFYFARFEGTASDQLIVSLSQTEYVFSVTFSSSTNDGITTFTPSVKYSPSPNVAMQPNPNNVTNPWPIDTSAQLFFGDFDGDGSEEMIVFCPDASDFYVIGWEGGQAYGLYSAPGAVIGSSSSNITLRAGVQFHAADLTGSGADQLIIYNPATTELSIVQFNINSNGAWTASILYNVSGALVPNVGLNALDQLTFGDLDGDGAEEIFMYSPADAWVFVLQWNGAALELVTSNQSTLPTVSGFNTWSIGQTTTSSAMDRYWPVDLDGNGTDEIVAYSPLSSSLGIVRYSPATPAAPASVEVTWSQAGATTPWSLSTMVNAPAMPFSQYAFTGDQLAIYQYISGQLSRQFPFIDPTDVRSSYVNTNDTSVWASVAEYLGLPSGRIQNIARPRHKNFGKVNWECVQTTLYAEMIGIGPFCGLIGNFNEVVGYFQNQQEADLATVLSELGDTNGSYNVDLYDGVTAILSGAPEVVTPVPQTQAAVDTAAWLIGESLGSASQSVSYSNLGSQLTMAYQAVTSTADNIQQAVLQDAAKLPVLGNLAGGPWQWQATTAQDFVQAGSASEVQTFKQEL